MKYCNYCGKEVNDNMRYCNYCGKEMVNDLNKKFSLSENESYKNKSTFMEISKKILIFI